MNIGRFTGRVAGSAAALVTLAALVRELRQPRKQRNWYGHFLGVPYDFRRPTMARLKREWWRPQSRRLLTDRAFGVGWGINLAAVGRGVLYVYKTLRAPY